MQTQILPTEYTYYSKNKYMTNMGETVTRPLYIKHKLAHKIINTKPECLSKFYNDFKTYSIYNRDAHILLRKIKIYPNVDNLIVFYMKNSLIPDELNTVQEILQWVTADKKLQVKLFEIIKEECQNNCISFAFDLCCILCKLFQSRELLTKSICIAKENKNEFLLTSGISKESIYNFYSAFKFLLNNYSEEELYALYCKPYYRTKNDMAYDCYSYPIWTIVHNIKGRI
ncbi:MAG: hypothetical protein DRG78_00965 [Epsilonproteobacteria bacterium]|nr:MAG: hypothetical protein DRG78_00965 [Campylobacterota bacterium]